MSAGVVSSGLALDTASDCVRVGVVGTSQWTETFHLGALESQPRASVTALCGRNRQRCLEVAERHASPEVFTDYRDLFRSGLLDAVVIAAPDDLHSAMVEDAFGCGLHVLCEKPLARSAAEARAMVDAAEAAGLVNMVMFTWRWYGVVMQARRLLDRGWVGQVRDVRLAMYCAYGDGSRYQWRFDPQRGTGILGDFGSHLVDLARWLVGDISEVCASSAVHLPHRGADGGPMRSLPDAAQLLLGFADGARGTLDVSATRHSLAVPTLRIGLYGDHGSLEVDVEPPRGSLRGCRSGESAWTELTVDPDLSGADGPAAPLLGLPLLAPLTNLAVGDRLFVEAVLGLRPAEPVFDDGWRAQQVVDAAVVADRDHRWVPVAA